ncbi:hypothetical protein [Pseudorhodoplanes sp.]|uniref:hypothetical protein n=1 Tax=Pseudorhodoplanes sp. TaxID=1934341 RepID=UPI003D130877
MRPSLFASIAATPFLLATTCCFGQNAAIDCFMARSECKEYINKRVWITAPRTTVPMCRAPGMLPTSDCKDVAARTFIVRSVIAQSDPIRASFEIETDKGATAFMPLVNVIHLSLRDPVAAAKEARAACERKGAPAIGMTVIQAHSTCWGRPFRRTRSTTADGIKELHNYQFGDLIFQDGSLSQIIERSR